MDHHNNGLSIQDNKTNLALSSVKKIFDNQLALQTSTENATFTDEFIHLCRLIPYPSIFDIFNKIDYFNKLEGKDVLEKEYKDRVMECVLEVTVKQYIEKPVEKLNIDYIYGLRSVKSDKYSYNDAVLFFKVKERKYHEITQYIGGADFVGRYNTYSEVMKKYRDFKNMGWIPMTFDDIKNTSGIHHLDLNVKIKPNYYFNLYNTFIIATSIIFYLYC